MIQPTDSLTLIIHLIYLQHFLFSMNNYLHSTKSVRHLLEKHDASISASQLGKINILFFLSIFLSWSHVSLAQDCNSPEILLPGSSFIGSTVGKANNINDYCNFNNPSNTGPEVLHRLEWPGGNLEITLDIDNNNGTTPDLNLIVLQDCNDLNNCITWEYSGENGNPNRLTLDAGNLDPGTYYIIVDGWVGAEGSYTLNVGAASPPSFCEGNTSTSLQCGGTVSFTPFKNNITEHCGQTGYIGPERVYEINWDGGDFLARLEDKASGQELILYDECDPGNCLEVQTNEIRRDLAAGTYFLVVDSKDGAEGRYTLSLSNPTNPCLLADFNAEDITGPSCANPGQTISVEAKVGNKGSRKATDAELAVAVDRFYLYTKPTFRGPDDQDSATELQTLNSVAPNPGQTLSVQGSFVIPNGTTAGDYFIIFFTDADLRVTEAFAAGNIVSYSISIGNTSSPDYLPTNFTGPDAANPGQAIEMSLTIKNEGSIDGLGNGGKDKYYINTKNELDGNEELLVPSANTNTTTADIAVGQSFDVTGTITIPSNTAEGTYYILFHHDADDKVDECNEGNNVAAHKIVIRAGNPDYVPLDFRLDGKTSLTVAQGQRVSGSLLAKNQGNGDGTKFTSGKYYYSADATFDQSTDLYLGEANDIEPLSAGMGTGEVENIKIPSNAQIGTGYIFYWIDADKKITESNESNNVAQVVITVTAASANIGLNASFTASNTNPCKETEVKFSNSSTGGNTVLDQSTKDNDGILENATNPSVDAPSGFGKALNFEGVDSYVDLPAGATAGASNFTFEARFLYEEARAWQKIMHFGNSPSKYLFITPTNNNGLVVFGIADIENGVQTNMQVTSRTINLGEWHHVALVWNGSERTVRFYIDGLATQETIDVSQINPAAFFASINTRRLGKDAYGGNGGLFEGRLDEVRIWSTARSLQQIQANKDQELRGNEAGLLAYYNFNQALSGGTSTYSWSFPGGTPSSSTDANPTVTYANTGSYNVSLTVNNGGSSDTETKNNFINVKSCAEGGTDYCAAAGLNGTGSDYITSVNLNTLSNTSEKTPYSDFTNLSTSLEIGKSYTLEIGLEAVFSKDAAYGWIDFNQNGEFDESELIEMSAFDDNEISRGTFTVPPAAVLGTTRLRVRSIFLTNQVADPCGDYFGEVEDYSVVIQPSQGGGGEPDWPVVETGDNHTVIVESNITVDINGMQLAVGDYLGVFYTDGNVEKAGGKARWTGQNISITVYGDDNATGVKDGFTGGETFKWRVWKANTQTEFKANATYKPTSIVISHTDQFGIDGISALASLNATSEQGIVLEDGWNMISSYVQADAPNIEDIFAEIKNSIALVKNGRGKIYFPSSNINTIGNWEITEGYKVKNISGGNLNLTIKGQQVDPTTPLNLKKDWNIMAYLRDTPQNAETALASIKDEIILVKNIKGKIYFPQSNINTIGDLTAGQGYQIKLKSDVSLQYNARIANPGEGLISEHTNEGNRQRISSEPDWPLVETGDNHTIIIEAAITTNFEGQQLQTGDYVGVFFDLEGSLVCGGKAEWTGENIALTAYGDDNGTDEKDGFSADETFIWKVWRAADEAEFRATAEFNPTDIVISHSDTYANDGISSVKSLVEMMNTGITSFDAIGIKLYPNPSTGQFWIELPQNMASAKVSIFNYTGQIVFEGELMGQSRQQINLQSRPDGIYIVQIQGNKRIATSRILLKK